MLLVERIRKLCAANEMSISALEKKAGIGNGVISRWNESSPTLSSLESVAVALGVTVVDLLRGEEEQREEENHGS